MNSATADPNASNSPESQSAVRWSDLLACAVRLLKVAACQECDGSGAVQVQTRSRQYVTRGMAMDAQCPEMEGSLYNEDEFEVQQCQWCAEKAQVIAAYEAQANDQTQTPPI